MVVFVGQVASADLGREAFQEVNYQQAFGGVAKAVLEPLSVDDIPAITSEAFIIANAGRPGPVIVVLREELLSEDCTAPAAGELTVASGPDTLPVSCVRELTERLAQADSPLLIVGSNQWSDEQCDALRRLAERYEFPVATAFRRQDIMANHSASFAGYLGLNTFASLWSRVEESDLIITIGTRLDQQTTRGYCLLESDEDARRLVQFYEADAPPREKGLAFRANVQTALNALEAALGHCERHWPEQTRRANAAYHEWLHAALASPESGVDLREVCEHLDSCLPDNAVITIDAGNFTAWPQRFIRFARPRRFLAPINGAMGYGIPAALGAAQSDPHRVVVAFVGDGGALMTGNELATAVQYGIKFILIVVNNAMYGTIRLHQEKRYPDRVMATDLRNPDFVEYARSFGAFGERITHAESFPQVFAAALRSERPAVIELVSDQNALLPDLSLRALQQKALDAH